MASKKRVVSKRTFKPRHADKKSVHKFQGEKVTVVRKIAAGDEEFVPGQEQEIVRFPNGTESVVPSVDVKP